MSSPNAANCGAFAFLQICLPRPKFAQGDTSVTLFCTSGGPMQRMFLKALAIACLMNLPAHGQSLGEIAREYREKQNAQESSGAEPKVFTNKDLPANPEGYQAPRGPQPIARTWDSEGTDGPSFDRSSGGTSNPFARPVAQPGYRSSPQGMRSSFQGGQQGMRSVAQGMEGQRGGEQWRQQIQER